jgi:hypothetical protein
MYSSNSETKLVIDYLVEILCWKYFFTRVRFKPQSPQSFKSFL